MTPPSQEDMQTREPTNDRAVTHSEDIIPAGPASSTTSESTIESASPKSLASEKVAHPDVVTRDLLFLPIPKYLRYDPDGPTKFDTLTNILFAVASTCGEYVSAERRRNTKYSYASFHSCSKSILLPAVVEYDYVTFAWKIVIEWHLAAVDLSQSFNVSYNEVSRIPTLIQAGYVFMSFFRRYD